MLLGILMILGGTRLVVRTVPVAGVALLLEGLWTVVFQPGHASSAMVTLVVSLLVGLVLGVGAFYTVED